MTISIVINNYNYGQYLRECIESALGQTKSPLEVIVVDDGSSDDSLAIAKTYGNKIRLIAKSNGGQGSAYNAGFLAARGSVISFLDSDDVLDPDFCRTILAAFGPGVSKVHTKVAVIDEKGVPTGWVFPRLSLDAEQIRRCSATYCTYPAPPGSANVYRREFLAAILPLPEAEWRIDADCLPINLAPFHGEVVGIEVPLVRYRRHAKASTAIATVVTEVAQQRVVDRMSRRKRLVAEGAAKLFGQRGLKAMADPTLALNLLILKACKAESGGALGSWRYAFNITTGAMCYPSSIRTRIALVFLALTWPVVSRTSFGKAMLFKRRN